MAGDWDDSLKMLVNDNSQDFVTWLFKGAKATGKLLTQFKKRTIDADALVEAVQDGDQFLVHFEFQSTNDSRIAERLLAEIAPFIPLASDMGMKGAFLFRGRGG